MLISWGNIAQISFYWWISVKSSLPTIFPSYIKRTGLDFTAAKVVQVAQRVLVTTAIAIECYVTNYEADHKLYF